MAIARQHYFAEEPVNSGLGCATVPDLPGHEKSMEAKREQLASGVSVLARCAATGQAVGLAVTTLHDRETTPAEAPSFAELKEKYPEPEAKVYWVANWVYYPGDIFADHPGLTKFGYLEELSTRRDFRGRGVATTMARMSLGACRALGAKGFFAISSAAGTSVVARRLGMEAVKEFAPGDIVLDGEKLSPVPLTGFLLKIK